MRGRAIAMGTACAVAVSGVGFRAQGPGAAPAAACAAAVAAQLAGWGVVSPALAQPPPGPGERLQHWPTATTGTWIVERQAPGEASLTRVAPDQIVRIRWTVPACVPSEDTRPRAAAPPPVFTDRDLDAVVRTDRPVLLYLWSPHMPLSVDGWREVQRAAAARGLTVEPLLDPQANREFAAASARAAGLPDTALRVVDSVELQFRELALHAPSLALFSGGRMRGSPLRGYRTAAEYETFLARTLDGR